MIEVGVDKGTVTIETSVNAVKVAIEVSVNEVKVMTELSVSRVKVLIEVGMNEVKVAIEVGANEVKAMIGRGVNKVKALTVLIEAGVNAVKVWIVVGMSVVAAMTGVELNEATAGTKTDVTVEDIVWTNIEAAEKETRTENINGETVLDAVIVKTVVVTSIETGMILKGDDGRRNDVEAGADRGIPGQRRNVGMSLNHRQSITRADPTRISMMRGRDVVSGPVANTGLDPDQGGIHILTHTLLCYVALCH